jgi:hypothetical protein
MSTRCRHTAPDLLLVLSLTTFVAGMGATAAGLAPPGPWSEGRSVTKLQDWSVRPRAVALARLTPAPRTRDLLASNPQTTDSRDRAIPRPCSPDEQAEQKRVALSIEAMPHNAEVGDVRCFLAQMAVMARKPKLVDFMTTPNVSALDAHLEALMDAAPVLGTRERTEPGRSARSRISSASASASRWPRPNV